MLQQTQMSRVVERYEAFIRAWPTVRDLAAADERSVLAAWQGLGYYQRARRLHAAARECVSRFGGVVPHRVDDLQALPGVGRYTAGAVASIVHGERVPIVDGNVARVLLRVHGKELPAGNARTNEWLWQEADRLVRAARKPAALNEGLMELGALVCTPKSPRCSECPWAERCKAKRAGKTASIPSVPRRSPRATVHWDTLVMESPRGVVLEQRPEQGLWATLWQSPTIEHKGAEDADAFDPRRAWTGVGAPRAKGSFVVVTSSRRVSFRVWTAKAPARLRRGWSVVPWNEIGAHAMGNAMRRVLALAATPREGARGARSRGAGATRQTPVPAAASRPAAHSRLSGRRPRGG